MSENHDDPLFIAALEKASRVLDVLAAAPAPRSLTELAADTGMGRSSIQRLTHSLTRIGYLRKDPATKRFSLGARAMDLAYGYLSSHPLVAQATPHLIDACERCRETVNMSELDGADIVFIIRIPVRRANIHSVIVGRRMPAFSASSGRAMMAFLPRDECEALLDMRERRAFTRHTITDRTRLLERIDAARSDGFAIADQEVLEGQITVSAPVLSAHGRPLAAIQSTVSVTEWTLPRVRSELAPLIVETANIISRPSPGEGPGAS